MIGVAWQFEVKRGKEAEVERFFGADGDWTALARHSRSFLGSSFLRAIDEPVRYLLIEYWSEMVVYEKHAEDFRDEIRALEKRRDLLLVSMQPMGLFNALDVPDRAGPTWSRRSGTRIP